MEPPSTTEDAFLGGRVTIRQPAHGLRSGLDAVFLAAACPARAGDTVLEAGCGAGAASLCLAARVPGVIVTGVEIEAELAALASENAARNGAEAALRVVTADVTGPWTKLEAAGIVRESFDHVMANPPFHEEGEGRTTNGAMRQRACVMPQGGLERWVRFLTAAARAGGMLTLIHRADMLGPLLRLLDGRFGGLEAIPLFPRAKEAAIRVIIRGKKGSRAPLALRRGLVLHEPDGAPTAAAASVLRHGASLDEAVNLAA